MELVYIGDLGLNRIKLLQKVSAGKLEAYDLETKKKPRYMVQRETFQKWLASLKVVK